MSDSTTLDSRLEEVLDAARKLPVCDGAAKLHALVTRLQDAWRSGSDVAGHARELASAARAALADDPWVQFETVVQQFRASVTEPSTPMHDGDNAAGSSSAA